MFEGTKVACGPAWAKVNLNNGGQIHLGPGARATIYMDRMVLEDGYGDVRTPLPFHVLANTLSISPSSRQSTARIAIQKAGVVQVAASEGAFRVNNAAGVLVSRVDAGAALEFDPQVQAPAAPTTAVGCLMRRNGRFVVYDATTKIFYQLRGTGFENEWGNRIQINGTTSPQTQAQGSDTQVVDVTSVVHVANGGCEQIAKEVGGELPSAAPVGTPQSPVPPPVSSGGGMSAGTKVAIAVAVVGGGAGAGIYFATKKNRSQ